MSIQYNLIENVLKQEVVKDTENIGIRYWFDKDFKPPYIKVKNETHEDIVKK
jgi:hypothetical protein